MIEPKEGPRIAKATLQAAVTATRLDPRNLGGAKSQIEALLLFTAESSTLRKERLELVNKRIETVASREPESEVPLRRRVVMVLLEAEDADTVAVELPRLLTLNDEEGAPHGRLSDDRRAYLVEQAAAVAARKARKEEPKQE